MGKKKSHEEEFRRGSEQLRQSGLQLEPVSPELVPGLEEQWGARRETDLAIVFLLGKIADSVAAEALLRIEKSAEDKDLKKEIRRSLFKLSPKGFKIPEDKRVEEKVSVPWEYADMILYEGFEKAKSRRQSELENFHQLRSIVNTGKPKAQDHPVYRRLHSEDVREGAWRELSRRLLDEPELRFWILDPDWAEPFLAQLQEAQSSRLVLNPIQKEERIAGIVRDAVKTLCAGETGNIVQRRMEDIAFYLVDTGRAQLGRLALAVALQIKDGDPGPLDIAFLTGLVQKSFAFYMSEQKSKAEEEPSFIVKP